MSRHCRNYWAAAFTLISVGVALGDDAPAPVQGDAQYAVFLHETRPIFLRLQVQIDGKPFRAAWRETVERLFVYLDADADGVLGEDESTRAADWWQRVLAMQPPGSNSQKDASNPTATFANRITDGKVTRAEWVQVAAPLGDRVSFSAQSAVEGPSQQLWTHLDLDADAALSADELQRARQSLSKLDFDDDESIAADELTPYANPFARFSGQQAQRGRPISNAQAHPLIPLSANTADEAARTLLARYDGRGEQQANSKLSRPEIGLERSDFDRLDTDRDGALDAEELAGLAAGPPCHLALRVELGAADAAKERGRLQVYPTVDGKPAPLASQASIDREGKLALTIGQVRLQIAAAGGIAPAARNAALKAQFNAADSDKNGYLDKPEAQRRRLQQVFDAMDRNADDKVFEDEFLAYLRQELELTQNRAAITIVDQGRVLFDAIDANRDGRLSLRELREAQGRLSPWDSNGDGKLVREEVPHLFGVTIGPSASTGVAVAMPVVAAAPMRAAPSGTRVGPRWFQKMDRNGDGDLSPREFPGTREQFAELDANGDGLIDASEAEKITPAPQIR